MSSNDIDPGGHFVFNGLYKSDFSPWDDPPLDPALVETEFGKRLPNYDPHADGEEDGFEKVSIRDAIRDNNDIPEGLIRDVGESIIGYRYRVKTFDEEVAVIGGEEQVVDVPRTSTIDIYWCYPDYVFFRGASGKIDSTKEVTQDALYERTTLRELTFDSDFLLWLYYKYRNGGDLPGPLKIERLTDSETSGDENYFGLSNVVGTSLDLAQSTPLLLGILRDRNLTMLEGDFAIDGIPISAKVEDDRIQVFSSEGALDQNRDSAFRIASCAAFLKSFATLYEDWVALSPTEKYPPKQFFQEMFEECRDNGVMIREIPDSLLENYANKRKESAEDWLK